LGSFGYRFKPAIVAFAGAKANTGNGIFPFPQRAPWVRFVIFVVHQTRRFCDFPRHPVLYQCPTAGRKKAAAQPLRRGLRTSYAAFKWWDPTRAGSKNGSSQN
jgi:hypothetical protein